MQSASAAILEIKLKYFVGGVALHHGTDNVQGSAMFYRLEMRDTQTSNSA